MKGKRGITFMLVAATVISGVLGGCTGKTGLKESDGRLVRRWLLCDLASR